jgi:putative ABC transport system ATP-binding protein
VAVVGPSGSGKSTLLNVLGLLDRPSTGSYRLDGIETTMLGDGARTKLRGRRIGFVFQSFHLLAHRSVVENVMLAELYGGRSRRGRLERARVALERVGLGHRAAFPPDRLSGGERQRAAIARAMLGGPSLLLCDEPTGNLDSRNTEGVLALFDELRDQGLTIVVITHEAEVSERATRRVRIVGRHPGRAHPRPARSRRSDGDPLAAGAGVAGSSWWTTPGTPAARPCARRSSPLWTVSRTGRDAGPVRGSQGAGVPGSGASRGQAGPGCPQSLPHRRGPGARSSEGQQEPSMLCRADFSALSTVRL